MNLEFNIELHEGMQLEPQAFFLEKVPPGPWRSLGGFLDYEKWEARERFLELDRAIEVRRKAFAHLKRDHVSAIHCTEVSSYFMETTEP